MGTEYIVRCGSGAIYGSKYKFDHKAFSTEKLGHKLICNLPTNS